MGFERALDDNQVNAFFVWHFASGSNSVAKCSHPIFQQKQTRGENTMAKKTRNFLPKLGKIKIKFPKFGFAKLFKKMTSKLRL